MARLLHFIAHPNVVVNPAIPVPRWPLSAAVRARMAAGLQQPWIAGITAVRAIAAADTSSGSIAIVSHGAVGTLLHCFLAGQPIDRRWDQPANGGGNFYTFSMLPPHVNGAWAAIDHLAADPSGIKRPG